MAVETLYTQEMLAKYYLLRAAVYTTYAYSDEIIDSFIADLDYVFGFIKKAIESGDIKKHLNGDVIYAGFKRLL